MADLNWTGLILGVITFLLIGLFHPIVIKAEYYFGARPTWIFFLLAGVLSVVASVMVQNIIGSTTLGIIGFSCFWSIGELFEQEKRVQKGWFPRNPKRTYPFDKKKEDK